MTAQNTHETRPEIVGLHSYLPYSTSGSYPLYNSWSIQCFALAGLYHPAMLQGHKIVTSKLCSLGLLLEFLWWLIQGLVCQIECAPVYAKALL